MTGGPLTSSAKRGELAAFVVLTFAISWTIWLAMAVAQLSIATGIGAVLNIVAMAGPSIAALILAAVLGGAALRRLLDGFSLSLVWARWTVVAVALPLLMVAVAIAISVAVLGGRVPVVTAGVIGALVGEWIRILLVGGPLEEELGWRGFALPRLQQRHAALRAAVLLGLVWGLWHIPLYFVPGTGQYETVSGASSPGFAIGAFVVWTVGLSILFTWLFNETRGSLIVVMLFHASVNLGSYVPAAVGSTGGASFLYAIVTWIVALAVVWRFGGRTLASKSTEVVKAQP